MSALTIARSRAAIVVIAPAVLLAGFLYHPHFAVLSDTAAIAAAVAADTTRWGVAHLAVGVASGLMVLAFVALRGHLREAGEERWSAVGLPFIVVGGTLYTLLPGMEFAPLAAAKIGADIEGAQVAVDPWFLPTLLTGAVIFGLGVISFAVGVGRAAVLSPGVTSVVVGALAVMAASRFVPLGVVQFYVQGGAAIVALWPLAYTMWKAPQSIPAGLPRAVPAA